MFNLFKKKQEGKEEEINDKEEEYQWSSDHVKVYYEGEVLCPDYARYTLLYTDDGPNIREEFNQQPKEAYHLLCPHGKGRIKYVNAKLAEEYEDEDGFLEEYEGEFDGGQYHGQGKLVFRTGEILEGEFKENKFVGKKEESSQ